MVIVAESGLSFLCSKPEQGYLHFTNSVDKGMNPTIPLSVIDKIVGKTSFFNPYMATGPEKKSSEYKPSDSGEYTRNKMYGNRSWRRKALNTNQVTVKNTLEIKCISTGHGEGKLSIQTK